MFQTASTTALGNHAKIGRVSSKAHNHFSDFRELIGGYWIGKRHFMDDTIPFHRQSLTKPIKYPLCHQGADLIWGGDGVVNGDIPSGPLPACVRIIAAADIGNRLEIILKHI